MVDSGLLSKPWQKFISKLHSEFKTVDIINWKEIHFLGYFISRFESHYQRSYALSFQGPPSKCTEIVIVRKIITAIGHSNAVVKNYIDWIFECILIPKKVSIRNISYLLSNGITNDYLGKLAKSQKITKTTELPTEYKKVIEELDLSLHTYGDLIFVKKALSESPDAPSYQPYKNLFIKLNSLGFKSEILEQI